MRATIVRLPIASLERMSAWQFHVVRTLLFPTRRLRLERVLDDVRELDRRLVEIARTRNARTVVPSSPWYGFDPIHIRRGARAEAWMRILTCDAELAREAAFENSARSLRGGRPEHRRFFGVEQTRAQPSVELADGTTVALY